MEEYIAVQENEGVATREAAESAQDFDALLKQKEFQSEFDRRVSRALETARGKWAQETQRRIEEARAEAEALARMSGEERMAHEFAQREAQLAQREQQMLKRELRADAIRMIQEKGLPAELAAAVDCTSAETLERSLEAVGSAFHAAVQAGVEMRMRGSAPAGGPRKEAVSLNDADYYRANYVPGKR